MLISPEGGRSARGGVQKHRRVVEEGAVRWRVGGWFVPVVEVIQKEVDKTHMRTGAESGPGGYVPVQGRC